jgi:hypothetical protein
MRCILLASLFGLAASTQIAASRPAQSNASGLMIVCDKSRLNDGKPFQSIDVFIRKNGSITWNAEPITQKQFDGYVTDAARARPIAYTFISQENESPALAAKARELKTEALMRGASVADCTPVRGPNGQLQ